MSLPRLKLLPVPPASRLPRVSGRPLEIRPAHVAWLADGHPGYLKDGDRLYRGRWTQRDADWIFSFSSRAGAQFTGDDLELEFLDDYWGARAALVLDGARSWTPKRFRACRRHRWKPCALCSTTISEERPAHFRSEPNAVVCASCHERFVAPRSLSFIPGVAPVTPIARITPMEEPSIGAQTPLPPSVATTDRPKLLVEA